MLNTRSWVLVAMVVTGAAMRLLPHPPNFTPIAAIALFGGAHFARKRYALAVPLLAMLGSDLFIRGGFHALIPFVYGAFAISVGIGIAIRRRRSPVAVGAAALGGSLVFFFVTNFAVWAVFDLYPKSMEGLIACYVAAIPFFRNTVMGDLFFSTVLFGGFALAERRFSSLRTAVPVRSERRS